MSNTSHARWAGRQSVAEATIWDIAIGALRGRCIRKGDASYEVQARTSKGWERVGEGRDPEALLRRLVGSPTARRAFERLKQEPPG